AAVVAVRINEGGTDARVGGGWQGGRGGAACGRQGGHAQGGGPGHEGDRARGLRREARLGQGGSGTGGDGGRGPAVHRDGEAGGALAHAHVLGGRRGGLVVGVAGLVCVDGAGAGPGEGHRRARHGADQRGGRGKCDRVARGPAGGGRGVGAAEGGGGRGRRGEGDGLGALAHAHVLGGRRGGRVVGVADLVGVDGAGAGPGEGHRRSRHGADQRGDRGKGDRVARGPAGASRDVGGADGGGGRGRRGEGDGLGALAHRDGLLP